MTKGLMEDWFARCWANRNGGLRRKSLLLLDAFTGHNCDPDRYADLERTWIVDVPAGLTSVVRGGMTYTFVCGEPPACVCGRACVATLVPLCSADHDHDTTTRTRCSVTSLAGSTS